MAEDDTRNEEEEEALDAAAPLPHLMQKLWPQLPHASLLHARDSSG